MDEDFSSQWTPQAREQYATAAALLIEALKAHADLTGTRTGRQAEYPDYFVSSERLRFALNSFSDAELDLCGSVPFPSASYEDDDEDFDELDDAEGGSLLTVEHHAQFRITDEAGLLAAGRAAYLGLWPDQNAEDAELAVSSASHAMGELIHAHGWQIIQNGTEHLAPVSSETSIEQVDTD